MPGLNELELYLRGQAREFKKRIDATMPEHGVYYCYHGRYIGFQGLFRDKCDQCMEEAK